MLEIFFSNETKGSVTKSGVEKITSLAARREKKIQGEIEITVVGEKKIKSLNAKYRGKNKVTDVISFSWLEGGAVPGNFLGQIYICYPQIVRQARVYKIPAKEEFTRMLVHGLLHLVGYDHVKKAEAKKMFELQEKIISEYL